MASATPPAPGPVVVVGHGRAGGSLALALEACGWEVMAPVGRHDDLVGGVEGAAVVVIATPDAAVAPVSAALVGRTDAVVIHLAGSLGLDVLAGHRRAGCLHPLVSLPSAEVGAGRLRGAWFAVAGDPVVDDIVAALGGREVRVADADRAAYHAAACIASNHLVALLGQVQRVAASAGVPLEPYLELARGSLDNVAELGPPEALTGPAARGDEATLERHRAVLGVDELAAYDALADLARRLAAVDTGDAGRGSDAGHGSDAGRGSDADDVT
jgi:predicted short-subunit dehydrogenase-like oxidoreductase (DUF2520 family)